MTADGTGVKVLFIMGKGRSGSTLLDNVLGQVPGVFSGGELTYLWDWGLRRRVVCGCGDDVLDCPVWSKVLDTAAGIRSREADAARIQAIWRDQRAVERWHRAPQLFARGGPGGWAALRRHADLLGRVYRTLRDVTGAQLVVDSSKTPLNPAALGLVEGIDGAALQLVRDPRAVGFSWQRTKAWSDRPEGGEMPRFGPYHTAASWTLRNLTAELVLRRWPRDRTTRLRYEDLCRAPRTTVAELLELAEIAPGALPFSDERTVRLGPTHTVGGNPNRMSQGEVVITPDSEWESGIDRRTRQVISTLTQPLLRRYGYPS
ncbi:MAG: sulfotransferase [Acidimicrobiia bacterium]